MSKESQTAIGVVTICPGCEGTGDHWSVCSDETSSAPKAMPRGLPKMIFFDDEEWQEMATAIHYPEHWDTAAYPTLADAIYEIVTNAGCSECPKKQ